MAKRIAVYTAVTGDYDELSDPEVVDPECDYICFTDAEIKSDIWQCRQLISLGFDSVRAARLYKCLPHRFLREYEYSIWVDGNLSILGYASELTYKYLENKNLAVFKHPDGRSCIYDEAEACIRLKKDDPKIIRRQMKRYRKMGYPARVGLIASAIVMRSHYEENVMETMENWWQEIKLGSRRDQLSFNMVAYWNALDFSVINDNFRDNEFVKWRPHANMKSIVKD